MLDIIFDLIILLISTVQLLGNVGHNITLFSTLLIGLPSFHQIFSTFLDYTGIVYRITFIFPFLFVYITQPSDPYVSYRS